MMERTIQGERVMGGEWTTQEIGGRAAAVYVPVGTARPRFGVLYLHDMAAESPRERPGLQSLLDELRLACVAPSGGLCWWTARVCPEFDPVLTPERHLLDRVLPWVREQLGLGPRTLGLFGYGMGGQGALRLAFRHPQTFSVVAAIDAAIDHHELYGRGTPLDEMYDSKEQCRQDTAILHVPPSHGPAQVFFAADPESPWHRGNDRLHEKMAALGAAHEAVLEPGDQLGRALQFVRDGLVQESRRLL